MQSSSKKLILALGIISLASPSCYALGWIDLWKTRNQQGQQAFAQGHPDRAAELFTDPNWRGSAMYRSGQYEQAVAEFSKHKNSDSMYNKGNTLAQMGQFQQAIDAYNQSLKLNPKNEDAEFNRELVKKLMQEKSQQQQQSQQNKSKNQRREQQQNQSADQQQQSDPQKNAGNSPEQSNSPEQNKSGQDQAKNNSDQQKQQPEQSKGQSKQAKNKQQQNQAKDQQAQQDQHNQPIEQATEQWLRRIPDDPGGLIRHKILRDHYRYQHGEEQS